jgi:hypothetical protein
MSIFWICVALWQSFRRAAIGLSPCGLVSTRFTGYRLYPQMRSSQILKVPYQALPEHLAGGGAWGWNQTRR